MRRRDRNGLLSLVRSARVLVLVVGVGAVACGKSDRPMKESAAADTTRATLAPDTTAAPRVVPYDPSAPGAMRSGETPIRAAAPPPAPAKVAPAKVAPAEITPKVASAKVAPAKVATRAIADSAGDPTAIVRDYYAAIRAHDYLRAYRMWEASGQRGARSYAQFVAGFDSTETVDAKVGAPGRVEGAAGSRFVTVPLEIDARLRNGARQRFTGTYTLRMVVVPGASAAQRRWHLYAANMRQVQ